MSGKIKILSILFIVLFSLSAVSVNENIKLKDLELSLENSVDTKYKIMQFDDILTDIDKEELASEGIKVISYLQDKSYIVKVDEKKTATIMKIMSISSEEKRPNIISEAAFTKELKLSNNIKEEKIGDWAKQLDGSVVVVVITYEDISQYLSILEDYGEIQRIHESINTVFLKIDEDFIEDLASEEFIKRIDTAPPPLSVLNDGARTKTGSDTLQGAGYNLTGLGIKVHVYDGGTVRTTHNDLTGRVTLFETASLSSHSTHVAGTVAGKGISCQKGMAPNVTIYSSYLDACSSYCLYNYSSDLQQDYEQGISNGVNFNTNSIGSNLGSNNFNSAEDNACNLEGDYETTAQLLDTLIRNNQLISLWAAGNERGYACTTTLGMNYNTTGIAATAKNNIVVGATDDSDSMSSFSSWGPTDDGRIRPDIVAQGVSIYSTDSDSDSDCTTKSGTSMATPVVAGIVAQLLELYNDTHGTTKVTPETMRALLIHTAKDLGNTGPDYQYGWGRVNATLAADYIKNDTGTNDIILNETILSQSLFKNYTFTLSSSKDLKFTLAWTDYPGDILASKALVNDLDLIVKGPDSTRYYPWTLNPASPSTAATHGNDDTNNVEQVNITNADTGVWTIIVNGTTVAQATQSFALVSNTPLSQNTSNEVIPNITIITPANNSLINVSPILFNISSSVDLSSAVLLINNTNQSMIGSGKNWHLEKMINVSADYTFKVFGTNYASIIGESEERNIEVNLSCVRPYVGMVINKDTTFCAGTYNIPEGLQIHSTGLTLDCNLSTLNGTKDSGVGINMSYYSNMTLKNCTIQNYKIGLYEGNTQSSTIKGNTIINNTYGIIIEYGKRAKVYNNTIKNNSYGISIREGSLSINDNVTIVNNTIKDNSYDFNNTINLKISARGNYFGTTYFPTIRNKIYDNYQNSTFGIIDFTPYLTRTFEGQELDYDRPIVIGNYPNNSISFNYHHNISINFSENISSSYIIADNIVIKDSSNNIISGTFTTTNNKTIFAPSTIFDENTTYYVNFTNTTRDYSGNALRPYIFNFTTIAKDTDNDGTPDSTDNDDDGDGINDTYDYLKGNLSHVSHNLPNLNISINGSYYLNNSYNNTNLVKIMNKTDTLIEFNFTFSNTNRIDLTNLTLREDENSSRKSVRVKGLNIPTGTKKIIYIKNISNSQGVCIKDAVVDSISEVSDECKGTNETFLRCPGVSGNYRCQTSGNFLKVSGLSHSAVVLANDTASPKILSISPTGAQTSSSSTLTLTLSATTDENSTCRYSKSTTNYSSMGNMNRDGTGTSHTVSLPQYSADDSSEVYYIKCNDTTGNLMSYANSTTFSVDITETTSSTSPTSGGGGGGGGGSAAVSESQHFGNLVANIAKEKEYTQSNLLAVTAIEITSKVAASNVRIEVKKASQPLDSPDPIEGSDGRTYRYLSFVLTNLKDDDLSNANVEFAVSKSWLKNYNLDKNKVNMYRYKNNAWNKLTLTKLTENADDIFYKVSTPGFSFFAITAGNKTEEAITQIKPQTEEISIETSQSQENDNNTEEKEQRYLEEEVEKNRFNFNINFIIYPVLSLLVFLLLFIVIKVLANVDHHEYGKKHHKKAREHHEKAREHHRKGEHEKAHKHHKKAAIAHRKAAEHHKKAGNHEKALYHEKAAQHHEESMHHINEKNIDELIQTDKKIFEIDEKLEKL